MIDIFKNIKKDIEENPRTCDICNLKETIDNIILKYDNVLYMCDECAFMYYIGVKENDKNN